MRTTVRVAFGVALLTVPLPVQASELYTNISIDVKEEWFNSGVYVNAGDTLYLTGFGAFSAWANQEIWFNVSSPGPFMADQSFSVPGYPAPALIGRIGATQKFMAAGTIAFVSQWSGPLYFTLNDQAGAYADNRGTVIVWLRVKPLNTSGDAPPAASRELKLGQTRPNPFAESARIEFQVPEPSRVTVGVYDEAGHLVRTIADEPMQPGHHTVIWDGRDNSACLVESGIYFCRIALGSEVSTSQVVLIR